MISLRGPLVIAFTVLSTAGAAQAPAPTTGFPALANEFVFTTLSFSPSGATQNGLHRFTDKRTGKVMLLDQMLDDFSPAEIARQHAFYQNFRNRLQKLQLGALDPQTQADYELLQNAIGFALFSMDDEQFYRWKPQMYSENLGSALFSNISLEYADKNTRARDLAARLEKVPAFLDQAARNLNASNDVFRRVAVESIDGVRDLVKGMGADFVRGTPSESRYTKAQSAALAALDRYSAYVKNELPKKTQRDWRMGKARFDAKFHYYLQVSGTPNDLLRAAEDSMRTTRREMLELAEPYHKAWFPDHTHAAPGTDAYINAVVGEVMARIGAEHVGRDSLVHEGETDVAMLESFVRDHRLLSLADFSNLKVIPTPLFMRGIYGVAGAVFAPALEPNLSTFYWVTPIPSTWTADQAEAKMREYNKYKFLTISIHEAVPGHAVQGEYANRVTPEWRRLLRAIYGNTPYIEGWAVYAEHMMETAGANGGDPVKLHLNALKGMLRIYMNTIIDVRLHTMGMPGDSAVALMMRDAFQERPEAEAKLQRAQLDYVQLMTYMAGVEEWTNLRRDAERKEGARFNQCRYHDRVLLYGPVPVPTVRKLYMAGVAPTAKAPASRCEAAQSSLTSQSSQSSEESAGLQESQVQATSQSRRSVSQLPLVRRTLQDSAKKLGEGPKFLIRSGVGVVGLFVGLVPGAYAGTATVRDCHGEDCGLAQLIIGGIVGGFVGAAAGAAIPRLNSSCSYAKRLGRAAVGSFLSAIVALPLLVSGQAGAVVSAAVPPMAAALAIRRC